MVRGVTEVTSGYAGGSQPNPTYEQVISGTTGHAEVVKVTFDPYVITLEDVLDVFWTIHNPTTPNRQGNDIGPQYRSIILYPDEEQRHTVEASLEKVKGLWDAPVVTEVAQLKAYYPAEDYHRDYFKRNPRNAYCQFVINPKIRKLREKHASMLA